MKKTIIILIVVVVLAVLGFLVFNQLSNQNGDTQEEQIIEDITTEENKKGEVMEEKEEGQMVIGKSANGHDILSYTYGTGDNHLLFVGGIHGGYSWNTALVAFQLIDYLELNSDSLGENLKVTVIPVLNPDGLNKIVGTTGKFSKADVKTADTVPGRFNGNDVDLNRNFDCDWQADGTWQNKTVSGGVSAFSEPESQAIKNYIEKNNPDAVVVWYSSAGGVFASNCHSGVLPETTEILNVFADASGYQAHKEFNFYEITGDMTNWLAREGIPAISVLLTNHEDTEWAKNKAGIEALFDHYSE